MSPPDVVHGMLTALFLAAALRGLATGALSPHPGRRGRIDHFLHVAMALSMATMPWGRVLPGKEQAVFFLAAAVWFLLTAVRGHESTGTLRAATARRLPDAVGMAAMAWMALMSDAAAGPAHQIEAGGLPAGHGSAHLGHPAGGSGAGDVITAVLAVGLFAYAFRSLTREMLAPRPVAGITGTSAPEESHRRFWDGSVALGTAIMLLMSH